MSERGQLLCVTGMHRSGTSVVSRVVNLLGVDLGDERQLLDGADNPRGFWESLPLTTFAEDLLRRLGGSWDDPPLLADGWEASPRLDPVRPAAAELLSQVLGWGHVAGWKDPRSALLLPFWRTVARVDRTVLVVRDPRHVAASLRRRNGLPAERSAYLWLRYVVSAWRAAPEAVVVHYDDLLDDPRSTADRLARMLALSVPDDDRRARIDEAVEPALRHDGDPVPEGPVLRLAVHHHAVLRGGQRDLVRAANEDLVGRWTTAEAADRRVRRVRLTVRPVVPRRVRRRIRTRVGGAVSWPARRATVQAGAPSTPLVPAAPAGERRGVAGT